MTAHEDTRLDDETQNKLTLLFNIYGKTLTRKANGILHDEGWAEDAVQVTFMKMLRHMEQVGDVYSDKARAYLSVTLKNACFSILKKNKKYFLMDDETMEMDYGMRMSCTKDPAEGVICEELLDDIRKLPDIYANLLILYAKYHFTMDEIGAMLDIKPATVRKRIQRARKMLEERRRIDHYAGGNK